MVTIATSDNVMCISSLLIVFVLVYTCSMVNGETVSETVVASIDWFEDVSSSNQSIEATTVQPLNQNIRYGYLMLNTQNKQ